MKTIEQLEKENTELRVKIFNISKAWRLASSDISALFETQSMNRSDGSYDIDGQSCHELYLAIDKAPAQHLADIKADAVVNAANKTIVHNNTGFCLHCEVVEYANKLRGEAK